MRIRDGHKLRAIPEWQSYRPLDLIASGKAGRILQRWLLSEHNLEVELGRHARVPHEQRWCKWCLREDNVYVIGDESHSLSVCGRVAVARLACLNKMRTLMSEAGVHYDVTWTIMNVLQKLRGCSNKLQKRI